MKSPFTFTRLCRVWNEFFFTQAPLNMANVLRKGFAVLLCINLLTLLANFNFWFSQNGALPNASAAAILDPDAWSFFFILPDNAIKGCFFLLLFSTVLLFCGIAPRLQAAILFLGFTAVQHRAILLFDGEDTFLRMFCFYLLLMPLGSIARRPGIPHAVWSMRLLQIHVSLVYFSTALEKLRGAAWSEGTALYFVARLDDLFTYRAWLSPLFDSLPAIQWASWSVVAFELLLPFALWFEPTRKFAVFAGIVFHLSINFFMNLFLFQYAMMLGLLSFLSQQELQTCAQRLKTTARKITGR